MFSQRWRLAVPVTLAVLLLAGHAQAQCGCCGRQQKTSLSQGALSVALLRNAVMQQMMARQLTATPQGALALPPSVPPAVAARQLNALQQPTSAGGQQTPLTRQQRGALRSALQKQKTTLQTTLRKTTSALNTLEEKLTRAQERNDRQGSALVTSFQQKRTALEQQQKALENALQETSKQLASLQDQDGK